MCICGRQLVGGQVGLLTPCSLPVNCHCRTSDTGNTPWLPIHAQIKECDGSLVQMCLLYLCCYTHNWKTLPKLADQGVRRHPGADGGHAGAVPGAPLYLLLRGALHSAGLSAMLLRAFPLRRFFCDLFW